jgi:hypothetical protein
MVKLSFLTQEPTKYQVTDEAAIFKALFDPRSNHVGFVVEKMVLAARFLRVFRCPLPILIPPTAPYSTSRARTLGPVVADAQIRLSLTSPRD